jgi:short-subunit dehydrogenase
MVFEGMAESRRCVITGAYRDLGFETARQLGALGHTVILTARDEAKARSSSEKLAGEGIRADSSRLDVADASSIDALRLIAVPP